MENPGLNQIFEQYLQPQRILKELSIYNDIDINPENDLIIFGNTAMPSKVSDRLLFKSILSKNTKSP